MQRMMITLGIIAAGLVIGYVIGRVVRARHLVADESLAKPRRALQIVALLVLVPVASVGAIWALELDDPRVALMPVMGLLLLFVGAGSGLFFGRLLRLDKPQAGAYFCSSAMFNMGAVGALIVFVLLGESAFALVPFFRLFEQVVYYGVDFPIAKSFSPDAAAASSEVSRPRRILLDPFILVTLASLALGFGLNLSGLPRPAVYSDINSVLVPASSLLWLISIGMAMRFGKVKEYVKTSLVAAATKFVIAPVVVVLVAAAAGLGRVDGGLPLRVIVIMSSMPVGFTALVPPSLYKLDVDLANSAWLVTTSLLVVVIPLQLLVLRLLG